MGSKKITIRLRASKDYHNLFIGLYTMTCVLAFPQALFAIMISEVVKE